MRQSTEPCLSGAMVCQHLEVLTERYGAAAVGSARDELEPDMREELASVLPVHWIRLTTWEAFYVAMGKQCRKNAADLHWEIGRSGIERAIQKFWRLMLRFTTDAHLVSRTPLLHSKSFNTGRLASRIVAPGRAEMELTEWPSPPEYVRRGLTMGILTVLQIAGRHDVKVEDERRRDGLFFRVSWTP